MEIEEFKDIRIAYMRRTGEYGVGNKQLMEDFKSYLRKKGLLTSCSVILGIALDNPGCVDENCLRYDVGLVVEGNENIGLEVRKIPSGRYAIFEIPHKKEAVSEFWSNLPALISKLPADLSRPIIERYDGKKMLNHLCEFCIPLR